MFNFFRISFRLLYNRVCWTICVSADENNNMKVWLTAKTKWVGDSRSFHSISQLSLLLLCLTVFLWRCEAAKGGAKSVINRNRQRGRGNSYIGNNHSDDGADAAGTGKQRKNQSQTRPRHSFVRSGGKIHRWRNFGPGAWYGPLCRSLLLHQEKRNPSGR